MHIRILARTLAALLLAAPAAAQSLPSDTLPLGTLPFNVTLNEITDSIPNPLPALQGFASATTADGEWLLLTGRRSGLHAIDTALANAFPVTGANDSIYVVNPAGWQVWQASVDALPDSLAEVLTVTNAEYVQQDTQWLYLVGGYGMDSTGSMVTFPSLTAIDVGMMVDAVKAGGTLAGAMTRTDSFAFKVAGGALMMMRDTFYLVMGQRFDGLYSANLAHFDNFVQQYTENVVVMGITPPPGLGYTLYDSIVQVADTWASNFHRRDLNVVNALTPDGTQRLAVYGGVFTPGQDAGYQVPVYIANGGTATVDSSFFQAMSQYDAATLPLFDRSTGLMYTALFGGISMYYYDNDRQQLETDGGLPFIDDISVIAVDFAADTTAQWLLADTLPAFLGAEARVMLLGVPANDALGIVHLDQIAEGDSLLVGYLYGGIQSTVQQTSPGQQGTQTSSSGRVFEVWVTRQSTPVRQVPTSQPASD